MEKRQRKKIIPFLRQKLQSSSLLFTIYVSLIIYIVAASFVLMFFLHNRSLNRYIHLWELKNVCLSALEESLVHPSSGLNLYNNPNVGGEKSTNITIDRDYWGFFEIFQITAHKGEHVVSSFFLTGSSNKNLNALYLADNNSYVKATGKTTISGNIHVPGAHIQRRSFSGKINPVDSLRRSGKSLPKLNTSIFNNLPLDRGRINPDKTKEISFTNMRSKNLSVRMKDTALFIFSDKTINLADIEIKGKIIVNSLTKIIVYASAKLNDAIITAPEIIVKQGFKGNAQFITDSLLTIEPFCELVYPSVLAGIGNSEISIDIGNNSSIAGAVILAVEDKGKFTSVRLDKTATLYGLIFSNSFCYLGGTVYGSVYSQKIGSADNFSEINSLSDVTINKYRLKEEFILPIVFAGQEMDVIDSSFH